MILVVPKKATMLELEQAVLKFRRRKKSSKSVANFFGKLKRGIDGLEYQKQQRDEWG